MSLSPTDRMSRSQASLSPNNSPSQSAHRHNNNNNNRDTPLEALVSHLLASKRSLSSISTVWRANEIVTSARAALEKSVVLSARTGFLQGGIEEEVKVLRCVRSGIQGVYKDGQRDFKNVIKTLDAANARLESTMDVLRSTMVEATFRPAGEEPRSLLDFVDEQGVETMRDSLKESIRDSKEAQTDFDTSILSFENDLRVLKAAMKAAPSPASSQSGVISSPIPEHLHTLELHAQEMASLLDSLVSHFDLCVNAIRHTEGGYAAVKKAASSQPPGADPVSVSGVMNADDDEAEQPLTDEERKEMLDVLEKDAAQVEDVVGELREYLEDMELKHESILEHVASLSVTHATTLSVFHILETVSARLPGYIVASQDFRARWEDTKLTIHDQLDELENMRIFYENYYSSYDGLLLEVWRRRQAEEKCKAIMRKAMEQVERILDSDGVEREEFRSDVGEFLPVDLWGGINAKPSMWDYVRRRREEDAEGDEAGLQSVPELDKAVVEAAGRRDRDRRRGER